MGSASESGQDRELEERGRGRDPNRKKSRGGVRLSAGWPFIQSFWAREAAGGIPEAGWFEQLDEEAHSHATVLLPESGLRL